MKKTFLEEDTIIDKINEILRLHHNHIVDNLEPVDEEVFRQKSRFYKFKCWVIWGHLVKRGKTTCARCGKVVVKENVSKNNLL